MKNLKFKLEVTFIILIWLFACNGGFSQSFFPSASGICGTDGPVEVGTKFTTSANATITGLRFYKCSTGSEVYTLKLYSGTTLLTSATYSGPSGWVNVTTPSVSIIPGVTYTVSYYGLKYQYGNPFTWPVKNGTLTATGSVYAYKATNNNNLPTGTNPNTNYFADVVVQNIVPNNVHDTIYLHDTITQILPCYPPDSSLIVSNGNVIEKYYWFFVKQPPIHDTVNVKLPPDTVQIDHYLTDTIYAQCKDTSHVLITWDGYDSTNYQNYFDRYFEIEYFTLPNGQKYRFRAQIEKHWYKEQWDDLLQLWK